ncbi:hypothetical protein [Burkholderia ubonensis]|uniref:hypothetical protein n=1 Tax=Burkholderia ubonensis TaxID=101571 RepID=UPI000AEF4736|nr:hypothetical protein [Burkholderia ubonensis]
MPPAGEGNSAALPQQVSGTISRRRPTESYFNKLKAEKIIRLAWTSSIGSKAIAFDSYTP